MENGVEVCVNAYTQMSSCHVETISFNNQKSDYVY